MFKFFEDFCYLFMTFFKGETKNRKMKLVSCVCLIAEIGFLAWTESGQDRWERSFFFFFEMMGEKFELVHVEFKIPWLIQLIQFFNIYEKIPMIYR